MAALAAFSAAATAASAAAAALGADAEGVGMEASADGIAAGAAGAGAGAGAGTITTGGATTTGSFLLQADKAAAATRADKMMAVDLFMVIFLVEMKTSKNSVQALIAQFAKIFGQPYKGQSGTGIKQCSNSNEPG